ncbi:histidine kinase [Actinomadura sp. NPDC023710]|uniref:sensor histidine kinase n=1 Tax=Actinomadura sp. NPDC023710 TaxID=3158219 RepID=UPI0033FA447E
MRLWLPGGLVAGMVVVSLLAPAAPPYRDLDALGIAFSLASALCLLWVRTAPLTVLSGVCAILMINDAVGYPVVFVQWPPWLAVFVCFARYGDRRLRTVSALVTALTVVGFLVLDPAPVDAFELWGIGMCFLVAVVGGDAAHSRRAVTAATKARVLLEERTRLARDLHDALGHSVNVMVLQAAVGQRVFTDNPDFARETLRQIETLGRASLHELDQLLRVLHPENTPLATGLADLAGRVRAAGRELEFTTTDINVPAGTSQAVYRIVQEAVTNALRHTDTGRIQIDLEQSGGQIRLEIRNHGTGFPDLVPGHGLANMRERAHQVGGDLQAGPAPEGFLVRAILPVPA